jgi:hypothetical protein
MHPARAFEENAQANPPRAGVLERLQLAHAYLRLELVAFAQDYLGITRPGAARLIYDIDRARN